MFTTGTTEKTERFGAEYARKGGPSQKNLGGGLDKKLKTPGSPEKRGKRGDDKTSPRVIGKFEKNDLT